MPDPRDATRTIALLGNPNTGKSTLFGTLVGVHQRVGNYPGVTVEKKTGRLTIDGRRYTLIDLPGLYSLAPRSRDEMVSVEVLMGHGMDVPPVDAVLCIIDAGNLHRNLYLLSQVLDTRLPIVVGLTMLDTAERRGVKIDVERLSSRLGVPVVPLQAQRGLGIAELKAALVRVLDDPPQARNAEFPDAFQREVDALLHPPADNTNAATDAAADTDAADDANAKAANAGHAAAAAATDAGRSEPALPAWLARRLLLDVAGYLQRTVAADASPGLDARLVSARRRLEAADIAVPGIETKVRHEWTQRVLEGVVETTARAAATATDRADHALTHRLWGMIVFVLVMLVVFQAVFTGARPITDGIQTAMGWIDRTVEVHMAEGVLRSLLLDGVVNGVGGILKFLPQIAILFFCLALLEDCGYLSRAAYLMDNPMVRAGLGGKSFIPLLSSCACTVPGIMAARVIENERDRLTTILVAPLMTCSARLPIYALLIAAFIPETTYLGGFIGLQGITLTSLYLLGLTAAVVVAKLLKRTILRGESSPLLMELPPYQWPSLRTVLLRVWERVGSFLTFAGTTILAVSIVVWAALYYPHDVETVEGPHRARRAELQRLVDAADASPAQRREAAAQLDALQRTIASEYQKQSYLGRLGRTIEPVFRPLGWDWRIGTAVLASFPAREIVVATIGVIFDRGDALAQSASDAGPLPAELRSATWHDSEAPLFTLPTALSLMVFYALCAQCAATLTVIRQETGQWRWAVFTFAYMTGLAYLGALAVYQLGTYWSAVP